MLDRLPRDTLACWQDDLRCPWCGGDMDDATVRLGDLHALHTFTDRGMRWGDRLNDGQAGECQVSAICANCGKGAIVAFPVLRSVSATRLMPVRTAADAAWAAHAVQRLAET